MDYRIIKADEYRTMPWKNGRGVTTELFVKNCSDSDKYIYRLSIAGVTENGQFSDFSGYDRKLIMLEGNGVRLKHSEGKKSSILTTSNIAEFSGDEETHAELVNGPIRDFNIMTLREKCRSAAEVIHGTKKLSLSCDELLIYAKTSSKIAFSNKELTLESENLFYIQDPGQSEISVSGSVIVAGIKFN